MPHSNYTPVMDLPYLRFVAVALKPHSVEMTMSAPPTIIVIFGGTGDLAWRKLVPSLFDLHQDGRMPDKFAIMAVGRSSFSDASLRQRLLAGVKRFSRKGTVNGKDWNVFANHVTYHRGITATRQPIPAWERNARHWRRTGKLRPTASFTWLHRRCCLR